MANKEGIELFQSPRRPLIRLGIDQTSRSHPKNAKKQKSQPKGQDNCRASTKELIRKLPASKYDEDFGSFSSGALKQKNVST
jgi:hypothetical protein